MEAVALRDLSKTYPNGKQAVRRVSLALEEGEDLCTLVTCTPYGVNSHRLLVRGYRVENLEEEQVWQISGEAGRVDFRLVALAFALPMLLLLLLWTWLRTGRGRKGK